MVEPTVVEPKNHPPINPNDSGVKDRYQKYQEYQNFKCVLYL